MNLIKKLLIPLWDVAVQVVPLGDGSSKTVTGTVTDAVNKTAVEGVTISGKRADTGTKTDANGNFTIAASAGQTLLISNVGFKNLNNEKINFIFDYSVSVLCKYCHSNH